MNPRVLAQLCGLLGGAAWLVRWGAHVAGDDPAWGDVVHWVGLGLLGVAVAVVGAGTVSKGAVWLRLIVGIALPLLAWSVYAVVRGTGDGIVLGGVVGLVAVLLACGSLARSHHRAALGAHAATR